MRRDSDHFMRHQNPVCKWIGVAAVLSILIVAVPSRAAISSGPNLTNSVAAEERRILMFHQAEQSFQEQLKVGKERYNEKQVKRGKEIEAMAAELHQRQQTLALEPVRLPDDSAAASEVGSWLWPIASALAVGFFGMTYRMSRQSEKRRSRGFPFLAAEGPALEDLLFYCKGSGVNGVGRCVKGGFLVLCGSLGPKDGAEFRAPIIDAAAIREKGNTVVFVKDYLFPSASVAADALLGRNVNGWIEWKTKDGRTLDSLLHQEAKRLTPRPRDEKRPLSTYKPANSAAG